MSYYFPLGGTQAITIQNISYSLAATTASVPTSPTITALSASFATTSGSNPPAGISGLNITQFACEEAARVNPKLLQSGSQGVQGPTGSKGSDNNICPSNTVECIQLNTSLSAAFPGYPSGLNATLPSSSRYSIVCMEIPPGCNSGNATCPPYLPISSLPFIP